MNGGAGGGVATVQSGVSVVAPGESQLLIGSRPLTQHQPKDNHALSSPSGAAAAASSSTGSVVPLLATVLASLSAKAAGSPVMH